MAEPSLRLVDREPAAAPAAERVAETRVATSGVAPPAPAEPGRSAPQVAVDPGTAPNTRASAAAIDDANPAAASAGAAGLQAGDDPRPRRIRRGLVAALAVIALLGFAWWLWPLPQPATGPAPSQARAPSAGAPAGTAAATTQTAQTAAGPANSGEAQSPGAASAGAATEASGGGAPGAVAAATQSGANARTVEHEAAPTRATAAQADRAGAAGPVSDTASMPATSGASHEPSRGTTVAETSGGGIAPGEGRVSPLAEAGTATRAANAQASASQGAPFFQGRAYRVQRGDTLWDLARRDYRNPYFWPHIWNRNSGIRNPNRLSVDERLRLPTLQGSPQHLTAADRRSIARGYLRLYRFFRREGAAHPQYALVGVRFFDASVLPERLRKVGTARPDDALAAAFAAQLRARLPHVPD